MDARNSKKPQAIYVSNASPYVIEVNCDTDRFYDQQRSGKLGATFGAGVINASASADNARQGMLYHTATSAGGTRVDPCKSLYFTPNCSVDETVYATIFQEQEGGDPKDNRKLIVESKRRLCKGFPVKADQALIVGYDGGIHIAAHTSKIWVDTNYVNHFRTHIAHVANGSVQTIWVKCNTDRKYVRQESDILSKFIEEGRAKEPTETSYTDLYDFAKSRGFIKINGREAYTFKLKDRTEGEEDGATVYFAVYQEQKDGFRKLHDNFPAEADENVIVGYDGVIHRAEKGKVWTDTDGKIHRKTRIGNDIEEGSSQEASAIDNPTVSTGLLKERKN